MLGSDMGLDFFLTQLVIFELLRITVAPYKSSDILCFAFLV